MNIDNIINQEMIDWYNKRTNNHIKLVRKYCFEIYCNFPEFEKEILKKGIIHDQLKFQEPEMKPYILITWNYYCKDNKIDFPEFSNFKDICNQATEHHILNNEHHPEFWQNKKEGLINKDDRDGNIIPNEIIDATKMSNLAIAEMCADWCAMSEERGNTPFEWCDRVINKRWKFNQNQIDLIYKILNKIWK